MARNATPQRPRRAFRAFTLVELRAECPKRAAPAHRLAQLVEALADHTCVVHQFVGTESGTTMR